MGFTKAELAVLARDLVPLLVPKLTSNITSRSIAGGGGGGGSTSPHDLYGAYHTGELDPSQAPWALAADGSVQLAGNLGVAVGVTIDGVDLSAFKGLYDAHVAATAVAGHGSVGAHNHQTTANGGQLDHGLALSGLTDDDHTQYLHLSTPRTVTGAHTWQATQTMRSIIPEATDAYDLGSSTLLWRKGWLSELDTILFAQNTITAMGSRFLVSEGSGSLGADLSAVATSIDFGTTMSLNAFVIFRTSLQVEYMQVTGHVSGTTYTVTRNLDGSGANSWPSGSVWVSYGASGAGRIEISAESGIPRIDLLEQGGTYNATTMRGRLGNMNGAFGVATNALGLGVGDYTGGNYLKYDTTGGFALKAGAGAITLDANGFGVTVGTTYSDTRSLRFLDGSTVAARIASYVDASYNQFSFSINKIVGKQTYSTIQAEGDGHAQLLIQTLDNGAAPAGLQMTSQAGIGYLALGGNFVSVGGKVTVGTSWAGSTASTEATQFKVDVSAGGSFQWATGDLTTQRQSVFKAPTYSAVGASVFTNAATVAIEGPPAAGTNLTITNPYSLWTQDGAVSHDIADAGTANAATVMYLRHNSTATPLADFGVALQFQAKSSTTENQLLGLIRARWEVATHGSRRGEVQFLASDASSNYVGIELGANGAALLGFFGTTAIARPTVTGSRGGNAALASFLTALANLGLITNSTTA